MDETKKLRINGWAVFYLCAALLYIALFYTEVTGIWMTIAPKETPAPTTEEVLPDGNES